MKTFKTIVWKVRYAWHIRGLLRIPWRWCWDNAGAALENDRDAWMESPGLVAEDEAEEWRQNG